VAGGGAQKKKRPEDQAAPIDAEQIDLEIAPDNAGNPNPPISIGMAEGRASGKPAARGGLSGVAFDQAIRQRMYQQRAGGTF